MAGHRPRCAHCGHPVVGYATVQNKPVCHHGSRDCYRLVTVYGHPTPCVDCPGPK